MGSAPPRVVIAGLRGGSGKTTMTLGLISALVERGLSVAPFKKGPDYIDPFWLSEAADRPCHNLDPFLMGPDQVRRSFMNYGTGFDAAVIEGNRGLYDGMDNQGSYSTAELAKILKAPLLLVLDCTMTSRTMAALALGCQQFDPDLNLAGVILNPVGNPRQEGVVRRAIEDTTGLPVLGAVPRLKLDLPERHMGLVPPQEHARVAEALHQAARSVAAHVDVERVLELMRAAPDLSASGPPRGLFPDKEPQSPGPVIGVIKDAAFGFYYPENLEALANHGASLEFCSALSDPRLPRVDALYIGGGFPETHAAALADNASFRRDIRQAAVGGLPIYAECGGFMYLGRNLIVDDIAYPMAGVFEMDFVMHRRPRGHGYSICRVSVSNPFSPLDYEFKAHEFHYSQPLPLEGAELNFAYRVLRGKGILDHKGGLTRDRVLGTYHHVHALGSEHWAPGMLEAAKSQ